MTKNITPLKPWHIFFMIIGMLTCAFWIFIFIIILAIILIKPWGVNVVDTGSAILNPPTKSTGYDHPLLNPQQEALLESVGINPADVPTQITPAQQACAIEALGEKRAMELVAGATPSVTDITKAQHCFE